MGAVLLGALDSSLTEPLGGLRNLVSSLDVPLLSSWDPLVIAEGFRHSGDFKGGLVASAHRECVCHGDEVIPGREPRASTTSAHSNALRGSPSRMDTISFRASRCSPSSLSCVARCRATSSISNSAEVSSSDRTGSTGS